ncbi:MAG: hypothetical protein JSU95_08750 [Betaproteobacteria bacterium]|nr:MAG: hypothetical protein JSU95_08750 [Betaproteobacteria bacterium]
MKLTKTTIAVTIAALFVGGLMISPASAAVRDSFRMSEDSAGNFYRWSDISALTHGIAANDGNELKSGRIDGFYKWSDLNHKKYSGVPSGAKPVTKSANNFYKWSDINSLTHN